MPTGDIEKRVAALERQVSDAPSYPLQFEERCAEASRKRVRDMGFVNDGELTASFESYYNPDLRRCFVRVMSVGPNLLSDQISDAYTGREYAFITRSAKTMELNACSVVLPDGRIQRCTEADFDKWIAPYVADAKLTQ